MNKITRWVAVLCCCIVVNQAQAQFTVSEQKDTSKTGTVYTFPVFSSNNPNKPHELINRWIQSHELELEIGEQDSSIFENIWPKFDEPNFGTTQFSYRVIANTKKFLSVEIIKEGCGAYCEGYSSYYNFDAATGQFIELAQLFSEAGMAKVGKSVIDERVKGIKDVIKKAAANKDEDAKTMYEECLEFISARDASFGDFYIEKTKIHFLRERCSNHAMQGLDELGDFDNARSFAELHPYLSDYGKKLLY